MKNVIFILIFTILSSCSVVKNEYAPINDYLASIITDEKKVTIIEEKINSNIPLSIFKGKSEYNNYSKDSIRIEGMDMPLYSYSDWLKMNEKYKNLNTNETWLKNEKWQIQDFKIKNIAFMKHRHFPKANFWNDSVRKQSNNIEVYAFSNPIFYRNKGYAIFAISKCGTANFTYSIEPNSIIVMKKEKGIWVFVQKVGDGNYN